MLLLILSRLPFLVSHVDYGVFHHEHLFMLTDAAAVARWAEIDGGHEASLPSLDYNMYAHHQHAGGRWVTEAIRQVGRLTSEHSLREHKLIGLGASIVALCAYLLALLQVWPHRPARWAAAVFVCFLAPPTLLLWQTLMPMGHYAETWLFHALFLLPLVSILADRAGPRTLFATGLFAGVATAYTVTNVVFPVLLGGLALLVSKQPARRRAINTAALGGGFSATWLLLGASRVGAVVGRVAETDPSGGADVGGLQLIAATALKLVSRRTVVLGDGFARRGYLAVFEPAHDAAGTAAAYGLLGAALLGALYLLWNAWLLLNPRTRSQLGLARRMLGAQGLLLLLTLGCYLLLAPGLSGAGATSYLSPTYPAVLFGIAQGGVTLLAWASTGRRRWVIAPVVVLALVLGVGWGQSSLRNLRRPDLPGVERADFERFATVAEHRSDPTDVAAVEDYCLRAHPENDRACAVLAWQPSMRRAIPSLGGEVGDLLQLEADERAQHLAAVCAGAPPDRRQSCAMSAGAWASNAVSCELSADGPGLATMCEHLPAGARQACVTGSYRGALDVEVFPKCTLRTVVELCEAQDPPSNRWRERACLESTAMLMTGMPPLPVSSSAPPVGGCSDWPRDWQGLCQQLARSRRAEASDRSCEQVYRDRFATELPSRDRLIYQQCAYARLLFPERDVFPSCAIGIAKALDGLVCSWRGSALRR